ncbi:MAG: 50S ribosomal protein L14 [Candidatus Njordarchaeia archaeon]|nr:50S ribosomal protein L14 [Candidatus Korarchaeota archaeon]
MPKRKAQAFPKMKGTPGIQTTTRLICADNSGARILEVISVIGYKGVQRRQPKATIGDVVVATVKEGTPKMRKQIVRAVIIRQRMPYRRKDGSWIQFEDNAAVLINQEGEPLGSEIRGPIAREAARRWPSIGRIAKIVV